MRCLLALSFLLFCQISLAAQSMDNTRMDSIFRVVLDSVTGEPGRWELTIGDFKMLCITDETHDRMRIITPVQRLEDATPEEIYKCLEANFHSALDVRYAIADELIWVAFIHPLGALQDDQLIDALAQVRSAALTYGTIYTSTNLVFPKPEEEDKPKPKTKEPPVIRG